ncbi:trypco2 family protein [Streptomyces sp. NPDC058751]|uniref:trypco2 family protein n=1 Tax=Streptomyces sp. NPDC058751 TaxID=3346623 RepID=UPI0036936DD5
MSDRDPAENLVELAQAIGSLRKQLDTARRVAPEGACLRSRAVELEFQVALLSGSEITGGAWFCVLSGGGAKCREGRKGWLNEREARLDAFRRLIRYNTRRRHSHLGRQLPIAYENDLSRTTTTLTQAA